MFFTKFVAPNFNLKILKPTRKSLFKNIKNDLDIGFWELNLNNNESYWSSAFISNLGYTNKEVSIKLDYFLNHLIHPDDRNTFRDNFYSLVGSDIDFKQIIQVLKKDGKYYDFICKTNADFPINIGTNSKVIFFFASKITTEKLKGDNFYYRETAEMTSTGSWYVDFLKQKSYWDHETHRILGYPEDYIPSVKESYKYYAEDHQTLAANLFFKCALGDPFDAEVKMLTSDKKMFWARAIGKPVYNDDEEIVGIRGVFQNIDDKKTKELDLKKTSDIIASQNSRLFNFAHIVSHNLRSHTSNLSLITELINDTNDLHEKIQLLNNVESVSKSLNETIDHLNKIVTVQANKNLQKSSIDLEDMLDRVKKSILQIIKTQNAQINYDFSKAKTINYVPAYLESILLNLLTNAIKYKHSDRDPIINFYSYIEDDNFYLEVDDNGKGIDMKQFGDKIFGMYNTFHRNTDAVGIGLFLTKNQVEALNGEITVESEVGKGTTFKIKF